jgi:phosphate-selective porin OprO and OprP
MRRELNAWIFVSLLVPFLLLPKLASAEGLEDQLAQRGFITQTEASSARASISAAKLYYRGGTVLESPDEGFSTKVNIQLQERYTYTDNDNGVNNTSSFTTRRARIQLSGTALNRQFGYRLQTDAVGKSGDGGARLLDLRDAYVDYNITDGAYLRLGQYKPMYSRQEVNSSAKLQFADRSISSDEFAFDRSQGAMIGGRLNGINWGFQLFNGNSEGEGRNSPGVDTKHLGVAMVRFNAVGEMDPYEEGDIGNTEELALNFGTSVSHGEDQSSIKTTDTTQFSIDANLKTRGFSLHAEWFYRTSEGDTGGEIDDSGFYLQSGYFIVPSKLEIAARVAMLELDSDDELRELAAAINYHFWDHAVRAGLNFVWLNEHPAGGSDARTRKAIFQLSAYL